MYGEINWSVARRQTIENCGIDEGASTVSYCKCLLDTDIL